MQIYCGEIVVGKNICSHIYIWRRRGSYVRIYADVEDLRIYVAVEDFM